MAALHLVNRTRALTACLAVAGDEDAVLLLEDGVYGGIAAVAPPRALHALAADVEARGIARRLGGRVTVIDDAGFVTLVETHRPVVTWR